MSDDTDQSAPAVLATATTDADLQALCSDLAQIGHDIDDIRERRRQAHDVRFARWEGQSADLRRHAEDLGEKAQPFEGAADTRIFLADELIRDRVALYLQSLFRAEVQAVAIETGDLATAQRATTYLRWLRDNVLAGELAHEAELAAQWMEGDDPGVAVVGIYWKRSLALELKSTTVDDLLPVLYPDEVLADQAAAAQAVAQLQDLVYRPEREEEMIGLLRQVYASAKLPALRRALRELRETGRTELPAPYIAENRPCIVAHRPFVDIFFPLDADDIQRARGVYVREWLTRTELQAREHTDGWDPKWIEAMLTNAKGKAALPDADDAELRSGTEATAPHAEDFEVWTARYSASDDMGVPGIYRTVFSPAVKDYVAVHELQDFWHGQMPYVFLRREVLDRGLTESRGATVVAATHQYEIKVQRDARTNHTMLATNPPLKNRVRAGGMELAIRPGMTIPVRDATDVDWMVPPPGQASSLEIERSVKADCDSYHGRAGEGTDPTRSALITQNDADRWLRSWQSVFTQVWQLCQQFCPPEEIARVTGDPQPRALSRAEVRGKFDTILKIDVRDLNLDFLKLKMDLVGQIAGMDQLGTLNRAKLVRTGMRGIDPNLADQVVESEEDASLREVSDEQDNIVKMANGIEVPAQESGQNFGLRSKVLQDTIGKSPQLQQRLAQDPLFKQLVEARFKHFQQMLTQQQNAQIGRTGYVPVLGQ